jgi:hypothetical protein
MLVFQFPIVADRSKPDQSPEISHAKASRLPLSVRSQFKGIFHSSHRHSQSRSLILSTASPPASAFHARCLAAVCGHLCRRAVCFPFLAAAARRRRRRPRAGRAAHGETGDLDHLEDQRHSLHREAAAALLDRRRPLQASSARTPLPPTCPTRWPCSASPGSRGCGLAAPGGPRRPLCRAWACSPPSAHFSLPASSFPRRSSASSCWSPSTPHHRPRGRPPQSLLHHLGRVALATLTKGLIAPVFFHWAPPFPTCCSPANGAAGARSSPSPAAALLLIAAPWHILCGLYNPDQGHPIGNHPTIGNVHGFFYFYFVNEHFLRFFGQRYPHDYNKLPGSLYWLAASRLALPLEPLPARLLSSRLEDPPQLAPAPAPRRPARRSTSTSTTPSAKMLPPTCPAQVPRPHHLAAERCSPPGRCSSSPSRPTRSTTPSRSGRRSSSSSPAVWPALKRTAPPTAQPQQRLSALDQSG